MPQDLRYAVRMLFRSPVWTLAAALTLALGIGANTSMFSIVSAVLLKPLPFPDPDRLVVVSGYHPQIGRESASFPDFIDWREKNGVFSHMAALNGRIYNVSGMGEPERLSGYRVTEGFLPLVGAQPLVGRDFTAEEFKPGNGSVVILGEGYWLRRFGGDRGVVGRALTINAQSFTVVGVVPQLQLGSQRADMFTPLDLDPAKTGRRNDFLFTVARLKPGVTLGQAQQRMSILAAQLEQAYPATNAKWGVALVPLREQLVGRLRSALFMLLGVVGCVLLIGCVNVGNLLLARAAGRVNEIAIRMALGANRGRIVRQLLTESCLLACLGGALGVLFAMWLTPAIIGLAGSAVPKQFQPSIDWRVASFTAALTLLTGILFGMAPVWRIGRGNTAGQLKTSARGVTGSSARVLSGLTVAEIAISLMLVAGAGLLLRSLLATQAVNPGFQPKNLLAMRISLLGPQYANDEQRAGFFERLEERARALPGIEAVTCSSNLPLSGTGPMLSFSVEGRPEPPADFVQDASVVNVTPGYFHTLGIPLLRGRSIEQTDGRKSVKVAVINDAMVRRHFKDKDPIGQRVNFTGRKEDWTTIVGIHGDVKQESLRDSVYPEIYFPQAQAGGSGMSVIAKSRLDSTAVAAAIRSEVRALDPNLPVFRIETLQSVVDETLEQPRLYATLTGAFAAVALLLAAVGVYGVMAYSVAQRTREIGLRMALGASRADILRMVLRKAIMLSLAGVALGAAISLGLGQFLRSFLFGVASYDPLTYLAGTAVILIFSLAACWIPAWRASRVDPMPALRSE